MKILGVTSCPTGVAHTYMAAEALEEAAKEKGLDVKVETQGSVGIENELTVEDIQEAEVIIIAADTNVEVERFKGKPVLSVPVGDAIKDPSGLIDKALAKAEEFKPKEEQDTFSDVQAHKADRKVERKGAYKHLMNGVSRMLPFVVAGGLAIALSFVFGIKAFEQEGTLVAALMNIGGGTAFALMVPVLAGFIASFIADRPGFAPGMIGGMLASNIGAGFLAGYVTKWFNDNIKLPKTMAADPVKVIPSIVVGSSLTGALSMLFNITLKAPHGGIFLLAIPNAVSNVLMYALSIAVGAGVTALLVGGLKSEVKKTEKVTA